MDTSHLGLSKKLFDKIQKIIFEKIRKTIIVLYHPILKIGLKSSIISKVDHQIEKSVPNHFWKVLTNFWDQLSWGPFVQMSWDFLLWGPVVGDQMSGD